MRELRKTTCRLITILVATLVLVIAVDSCEGTKDNKITELLNR